MSSITEWSVFRLFTVTQEVVSLLFDLELNWPLLNFEVHVLVCAWNGINFNISTTLRMSLTRLTIAERL